MRHSALSDKEKKQGSDWPLRICIIAAASGEATGGLATYLRCLADHLSCKNDVSVVARFTQTGIGANDYAAAEMQRVLDHGRYQTHIIAPRSGWRPVLRCLATLVSRPLFQSLARRVYCWAYQPSLAAAMPATVAVVHYIGTGWELLGFAAFCEARRRGAAFTVWPAVHPGTWGDSPLDIVLYNKADAVFVQSQFEKAHLIKLGVEPSRLHQCGLAPASPPDGNGLRFRQRHGLGVRPLVLFIGRKDQGKGYHVLREAIALASKIMPDICLVAIGPEGEQPYPHLPSGLLLDLAQASEAEKADALAACDVFCLPSAHESFGIVYVEAWANSKPVVGGTAPAVRELISEGVTGFCVSRDKNSIEAILLHLLSSPNLCRQVGLSGKELQQNRFTWQKVVDTHQMVFDSLHTTATA